MIRQRSSREIFLRAEAERIVKAQESMRDYVQYTFPAFSMQWFHEEICEHLDAVVNGECKRLIVTLARRHGKSELITRRFPNYWHGKHPGTPLMNCTHNADVRDENGADIQRILKGGRVQRVFPSFRKITQLTNAKYTLADGSKARFETVNKGIAGKGYMCGIVDDYFGNREDAESDTMRKKLIRWYNGVFYGCIEGMPDENDNPTEGAIIVLCSPWHEGDLIGYLKGEMESGNEDWTCLNIQAEKTPMVSIPRDPRKDGEFLWLGKYPARHYEKIRNRDPETWKAQYQGILTKEGGEVAKVDWFPVESLVTLMIRRAMIKPRPPVYFIGDTGNSKKDLASHAFTVFWAVVVMDGRAWVIDEFRRRGMFHDLYDELTPWLDQHYGEGSIVYTENKSTGKTFTEALIRDGYNALLYDVPSGRDALSKDERFINAMPEMRVGRLGFSNKTQPAIGELTGWPKLAHKDRVDVAGMTVQILLRKEGQTRAVENDTGPVRIGKVRTIR